MGVLLTKRHKLCADLYRAGMLREAGDVERLKKQLRELDKEFAVPTFEPPDGVPVVGDLIYLPTRGSIGHGQDDVQGGVGVIMAVTSSTSAGEPTPFVTTHEQPGSRLNWEYLGQEQDELMKLYGDRWARPDPDLNIYEDAW